MSRRDSNSGTSSATADAGFTMNSITGKLVLALIRGGDHAHAGEEEAIDLVLGPLAAAGRSRWLDAGCGIGGTARCVAERGWGTVTGVDLDPANIAAANERHPGMDFVCGDIVGLAQHVPAQFDVIYSLNAFFLFDDQPAALSAMRAVARPGAMLAISDYVDRGGYVEWQVHRKTPGLRRALDLDVLASRLPAAGWHLDRIVSLDAEYLRWYEALVTRIESMRDAIIAQSSAGFYEFVLTRYSETLEDVRAGRLGGATLYATAACAT